MTKSSGSTVSEALERVRSIGAERATISMALQNADAAYAVAERLTGDDYQHPPYRALFQALYAMIAKGLTPSLAAIRDSADEHVLELIKVSGGREYLDRVVSFTDSMANLDHWIDEIRSRSSTRAILQTLERVTAEAVQMIEENADPDHTQLFGQVERSIDELGLTVAGAETGLVQICADRYGNSDFAEQYAKALEMNTNKGMAGFLTGWEDYDKRMRGFQDGRLYIVAAIYKGGKSMKMTELAKRIGVGHHLVDPNNMDLTGTIDMTEAYNPFTVLKLNETYGPGVIIDTEMRLERDVRPRLIASVAGIYQDGIREATWVENEESVARYRKACELIAQSGIWFAHCNDFSRFDTLKAIVRQAVHKHGARWVLFDYLRKPHGSRDSEYEFLGNLAYFLKDDIAEKYNIPVIGGAQLGRTEATAKRKHDGGRGVSGSGVQGSVKILQACDAFITLEDYDDGTDRQKIRFDEARYFQSNGDGDWFVGNRTKDMARIEVGGLAFA